MTHFLTFLLRGQANLPLALLVVACLAGGVPATLLLSAKPGGWRYRISNIAAFSVLGTGFNYGIFLLGLAAGFPKLRLLQPSDGILAGLAISIVCNALARTLLMFGRRSIRLFLLTGAMISCGLSLTVFTGMAMLARPFRLGYDLSVVVPVSMLGVLLCAFALNEVGSPMVRRRPHPPVVLFGLAALVVTLGSLGSILPLDQWAVIVNSQDSLSTFPVAIILAVDITLALAMSLSGWGIDSLLARQEQRQIARVRRLADSTFEGVLIHRDGCILDANEALLRMTGHTLPDLRLQHMDLVVAASVPEGGTSGQGDGPAATAEILTRDGERLPVEILSRDIDYAGGPARVVALRDIRERRAAEERIRHLANHDALTDLPNRRQLELHFEQAVSVAREAGQRVAICCIDLDGFKPVNDRYGHAAGDLLLRAVADLLRVECEGGDLAARVGGDEFVIVLQPGERSEQVTALGRRLLDALNQPFELDGVVAHIGASIGICFFPDDGHTIASLFRTADIALYRAKERGRNQICLFEPGLDRRVLERRALEQDLRHAIATGGLFLHYQPLFDAGERIVAFEALARWQHPVMGAIPPDQFIPVAERCGLILELGDWVLRSACREAAGWEQPHRIAVNLSPAQFKHDRLVDGVTRALEESGLAPERLEIEVTEGVLIDDAKQALPILNALRALKVRVVLDDFGTGYSSLGYLHSFPFDKIKIDRSFIGRIETDRKALTIVDAIIAMSHKLDLEVTAEGIETGAQLAMLRRQGCDEMQGFLLGRPMQASLVQGFIRAQEQGQPVEHREKVLTVQ